MSRRKFTPNFKLKVVLESLSERFTINQISQKFKLSPTQVSLWKKEFLAKAHCVFDQGRLIKANDENLDRDELLKTIGQQKVEIDFLKKSLNKL